MKKEELRHDPVRENIVKSIEYIKENLRGIRLFLEESKLLLKSNIFVNQINDEIKNGHAIFYK